MYQRLVLATPPVLAGQGHLTLGYPEVIVVDFVLLARVVIHGIGGLGSQGEAVSLVEFVRLFHAQEKLGALTFLF